MPFYRAKLTWLEWQCGLWVVLKEDEKTTPTFAIQVFFSNALLIDLADYLKWNRTTKCTWDS